MNDIVLPRESPTDRPTWLRHGFAIAVLLGLMGWRLYEQHATAGDADVYPSQPIEVVVPYAAGGGTDTLARLIQRAVEQDHLLPQPMVIINRPGGSGTIGSRGVKNSRPDGYRILCLDEGMMTAKISGMVPFGAEAFQAIAQSTRNTTVITVRADSAFTDVATLLTAAAKDPGALRFGVPLGAPPHFSARELERSHVGAAFNFIQAAGGQKRYSLILGGHIDVTIFSLAEILAYRAAPDAAPDHQLRPLAVLLPERHPSLLETPTALESGYAVTAGNALYWWAPKGVPPDRIATLAKAIGSAMAAPAAIAEMQTLAIDPLFREGDELETWIQGRIRSLGNVTFDPGVALPNFPLYTGLLVTLLGGAMVLATRRGNPGALEPSGDSSSRQRPAALGCALVVFVYGAVLAGELLPYTVATTAMVFAVGGVIAHWQRRRLPILAELALLTGLGTDVLFTEIFRLALP
jgi:tripartite-type tricarboxylate transporter receptor subunit TctC